jgi:hypothetical protein
MNISSLFSRSSRSKKTAAVPNGAARRNSAGKISKAAKKTAGKGGQKKSVAWKNERGGELANVRYVSPAGERTKLGEHARTGSKKLSSRELESMMKKRREYSEARANENVNEAKRKLAAYKGALNIVAKKAHDDPNDARKQIVVERAKRLVEEMEVDLEVAKERRRSVKLSAKKGY